MNVNYKPTSKTLRSAHAVLQEKHLPPLLKYYTVAYLLQCDESKLRQMAKDGDLKRYNTAGGYRWSTKEVFAYIDACLNPDRG